MDPHEVEVFLRWFPGGIFEKGQDKGSLALVVHLGGPVQEGLAFGTFQGEMRHGEGEHHHGVHGEDGVGLPPPDRGGLSRHEFSPFPLSLPSPFSSLHL